MAKRTVKKSKQSGLSSRSNFDETVVRKLSQWERPILVGLALAAALRVFVFCAAFPFFNNVDEQAHVDLVLKYARGHWPDQPLEHFDAPAARLFALYGTPEYLNSPEKFPDGLVPVPRWDTPATADSALQQRVMAWTRLSNHEANSPPAYYVLAAAWYDFGGLLGLSDGQQLYWIRFLNVPLIILLVLSAYVFCRDLYPARFELRLGAPILLAFLPQDVFYSVNSDVLSPLLFVISLTVLLRWNRNKKFSLAFDTTVGFLVAVTFLVKYTNAALVVILGAVAFFKFRRLWREDRRRDAIISTSVALLAAAIPVAICLGRNYLLFGDLTGTGAKVAALGWSRRPVDGLLAHPIFGPYGFWTFWTGLMQTFWRGEFVWHLKRIASPVMDEFYTVSSLIFLLLAASAWKRNRTLGAERGEGEISSAGHLAVWATVILSFACLVFLSVSFEYGASFYPSQREPYFTSGRLIAGALVPFLILYVDGVTFLLRPFSSVGGPLLFTVLTSLMMTISELELTRPILSNPYNWFHLP